MSLWDSIDVPSAEQRSDYRKRGWWRDETYLDDLDRYAASRPDHPAVIGCRGGSRETVTYAELAGHVDRFAGALVSLGVQRGDLVVLWLPNLWELSALYFACARIGAIGSPILPLLAGSEVESILNRSGAVLCVTTDHYDGHRFADTVLEVAPSTLKTVVVLPDSQDSSDPLPDGRDGIRVVDFSLFRSAAPAEGGEPITADEPSLVLYTSGTSGTMKAVVHSPNTIYAAARSTAVPHELTGDDVIFLPGYQTHMAGMTYGIYQSLLLGATNVVIYDNHEPDRVMEEVAANKVTWLYAAPAFVTAAAQEQRSSPRDTSALTRIVTGSAPVQPSLVEDVRSVFDVTLHSLWGMTENGAVTVTHLDDPVDWATSSDGKAMPWMQWRVEELSDTDGGRLLVRGANQCFGYLGQREVYAACLDDEGWFDTGDLAKSDGRDGLRIVGRRSDLINRSNGWMVSVLYVEGLLHEHPGIKEVALVGYPDPAVPACELVCAVAVPEGSPPSLPEVTAFLEEREISPLLWPDRIQFVWELPRNSIGKVMRGPLQERLQIEARGRAILAGQ